MSSSLNFLLPFYTFDKSQQTLRPPRQQNANLRIHDRIPFARHPAWSAAVHFGLAHLMNGVNRALVRAVYTFTILHCIFHSFDDEFKHETLYR